MSIQNYLGNGKNNARTARQLADMLGCDARAVTAQIEKERRGAERCKRKSLD